MKKISHSINLLVIFGVLTLLGPINTSWANGLCAESFAPPMLNDQPFEPLKVKVVPSLYINRNLIARNEVIKLEGKKYIVKDWYSSKSGDVIVVETYKSGKPKILKAKDFKNDLIVVDHVRLNELLSYENDRVIERYMRDQKATREEATLVFRELMKWFFLLHRYASEGLYFENSPKHFRLGMFDETNKIDYMWHEFILFTNDYAAFGQKYLGYYQHHEPFDRTPPQGYETKFRDRQRMYDFIRATLGEETLQSWYGKQVFADPQLPAHQHIPIIPKRMNWDDLL